MSATSSEIEVHADGSVSVYFDRAVYSASAVKVAVYKFAADFSTLLSKPDDRRLEARLTFPAGTTGEKRDALLRALCNEVIDQDLREDIARQTESTRNLILAEAFSKTSLLREE